MAFFQHVIERLAERHEELVRPQALVILPHTKQGRRRVPSGVYFIRDIRQSEFPPTIDEHPHPEPSHWVSARHLLLPRQEKLVG
jgi:hypothetical protein